MKKFKTYNLALIAFAIISLASCKKLVDVDSPVTKMEASNAYEVNANAIAVLTGLYMGMNISDYATGSNSISLMAGLSADELIGYTGTQRLLAYKNALNSAVSPGVPFWNTIYNHIYTTNSAIQGLSESNTLTPAIKEQLLGEAKFMRAFLYFYLVNLWEDVPLVTTSDFTINSVMARTPKADVYHQIIVDLKEAQSLLSPHFLASDLQTASTERIRPTKWAATAMLSRVYLFLRDWTNAETEASSVIDNKSIFDTVSLNSVFLKNSKEAIWQLQPTSPGWNTEDAKAFILTAAPGNSQSVSISNQLINAFEIGDSRKQNWIKSFTSNGLTYHYPYKYKVNTQNAALSEYLMVLRLGEQYLIRAEARAQQGKVVEAQSDLNLIRKRARLSATTASMQSNLISAVTHERQVELFIEWGHRWLDLKRTGTIDAVMSTVTPLKGGSWRPEWALYPIPQAEIQKDPYLTQNPGYQ
jgi:hypothetical protein